MIALALYLSSRLRRALTKSGRGLSMVADVLAEAMHDWRAAARKYPFAE